MIAAVLDVVPDSQRDPQQLGADLAVVADRIELPAPFDPPEPVFV